MNSPGTQPSSPEQLRDEALCRSVLYGALSLALHHPTQETFDALRSQNARLALPESASWLMNNKPLEDGKREEETAVDLVARVEDWVQTFQPLTLDLLCSAQGRLFGHTARGSVCPYETEYGQEGLFQQPRQLARIMGFYRAFGLTTRSTERERADHVSCELEFLDFLSRKEAVSLESGDDADWRETRKAIRLFLRDHLGRFGRAFARLLREQEPEGFFGKLGNVLYDFLTFECRRLGIQPSPPLLALRSAEQDKVPMACGEPSDLVQLGTPK